MTSASQIIRRRRNRKQRRATTTTRNRIWLTFTTVLLTLVTVVPLAVFLGGAAVVYARESGGLPTPQDSISVAEMVGATRLYDSSGTTLLFAVQDPLGDSRTWTELEDLPPYVAQATLIVEDADFLTTTAFDPTRTLTRLWRHIIAGGLEADNTLTARLVRNLIGTQDRARETVLVSEILRQYTPEEILEWHLNTNYYGNEAYGIEAAAQVYLGKSARDLTLDEAALLASIPTAPQFNPIDDETAARGRQGDTLRRMLVSNVIAQADYDDASRVQTVILPNAGQIPELAPDFSLYARQQTENILNNLGLDGDRLVSRGGLRVVTTLDLDLYYQAECALRVHVARLNGENPALTTLNNQPCNAASTLSTVNALPANAPDSGSLVVLDVRTGVIRAMIGNADDVIHQPGPTLYPFVYFEGFREPQQGIVYTPATMVLDIPRRFPGAAENLIYTPANPDNLFSGPVSLRDAASKGLLPPVVQIANSHGLTSILRSAHRMGLNSLDTGLYHASLLERGGEVALLDVAYSYGVFATLGDMYGIVTTPRAIGFRTRNPVAVQRIEDADGNVLWEYNAGESRVNVFSSFPELGYLINSVFSDSQARRDKFGADNPLTLPSRSAAVVNGMTADRVDNWTVGYTPQLVVGVHLGRTDFTALGFDGYALNGAATVWRAVTEYAHNRDALPPQDWTRPENIVEGTVCQISGLIPNGICPTNREIFIRGITPTQTDSYWQSVTINSRTRQLATVNTPDNLRLTQTYFIPPDNALDWWRANNLELPPTEADILSNPENSVISSASILEPSTFVYVRGMVEIRGVIDTAEMQSYQLAYGEGVNPTEWFNIGETQTTFNPDDNLFAIWDTTGLDEPIYTLELSVLLRNGRRERAFVQVFVDNTPPTVILSAGEQGRIYRWPDETVIPLQATVNDNFAVSRVEFFHNGRLLDVVTQAPYVHNFGITRTGTEIFRAVAYDAANNEQSSTEISVQVTR